MIKVLYDIHKSEDGYRWLRYLDGECFPDDKPLNLNDAGEWNLVSLDVDPVAFCGWRHLFNGIAFHTRAGVLPKARGQGLQVFMLELREDAMRRAAVKHAVTYTEAYGAASMRSLIKAGYSPFEPTAEIVRDIVVSRDRWRQMVYWTKEL